MLDEVVSNLEVNVVSACVCDCSIELSVGVPVDLSFEEIVVDIPVFRFLNLFNTVKTHLKGHATIPSHGLEAHFRFVESHFFESLSIACDTKRIWSYKGILLYPRQYPGHL